MSDKIRGIGEDNVHWSLKTFNEMSERDWRIFREDHDIIIKGGRVPYPMRNWYEGDLPNYIIEAVQKAEYAKPTAIQIQGIPIGLERRDMIGLAPTGSGKSAAYLIPLIIYLNSLPPIDDKTAEEGPYAMVLLPSRELAQQVFEEFNKFAKNTNLRSICIVGGHSQEEQALKLRRGVEVIIGTPGRIMDNLDSRFTILNQCHYVVLDEADTMIKENHEETLNKILDCIPKTNLKSDDENLAELQENECKTGDKLYRITMMFSATMTPSLEKLARKYLRCPSYISIGEPGKGKKDIDQKVEMLSESHKKERLRTILSKFKAPILVFVNHKPVKNAFVNESTYFVAGKSITRTVNANGNYNFNFYSNYNFKWKKTGMGITFGPTGSTSRNISYVIINGIVQRAINQNQNIGINTGIRKYKENKYQFSINPNISWTKSTNSINTAAAAKYWQFDLNTDAEITFLKKFRLGTDLRFHAKKKDPRFPAKNEYTLWNASLKRSLFKEAFEASLSVNDILNENRGYERNFYNNQYTETYYNTLKRFWMFTLTWNFNKNHPKSTNDF